MKKIKYFIMDVDGTLTDGKIYMGCNGEQFKTFNVKDGYGIHNILIPKSIIPVIITGRSSKILENRCQELKIDLVYQNIQDKTEQLKKLLSVSHCSYENIAYIGDDINDFSCMKLIKINGGLIGCPADAVESVKHLANFVSKYEGGNGAVRDFIEWVVYN